MAQLQVELVSVDRRLWSGEASMVIARTTEGEIGVLPGHEPLLGVLADGSTVEIRDTSGQPVLVAVDGGFLSVDDTGVRILAESAVLGSDVDVAAARAELERGRGAADDDEAAAVARRAAARLRAAGQSV